MVLIVIIVVFTIYAAASQHSPQYEDERSDRDEQRYLNNVKDQVVLQLYVCVHLKIVYIFERSRKHAGIFTFELVQQHNQRDEESVNKQTTDYARFARSLFASFGENRNAHAAH